MKNALLEMFPIGDPQGRRILFDPITAISAGVGLGGNIIGGLFGKSAAKKAGEAQQQAAAAAGQKVESATAAANPGITAAAEKAGSGVITAADLAAQGMSTAADNASTGANAAAQGANALLDPYAGAGKTAADYLNTGVAAGGDFNRTFSAADFANDPGYQFRQQQGQLALQRSAAANGAALGGGAAKSLAAFSQGLASQEYGNAFDRYQKDTQGRYDRLFGVSKSGQEAAGTQGTNLTTAAKYGGDVHFDAARYGGALNTGAAEYAGTTNFNAADKVAQNTIGASKTAADYLTQGANAKAAGIVGGANALGGGIAGGANAVTSALSLRELLKNPAASGGYYSSSRGRVR